MFGTEPGWRNGRRDGLKIRCPKGRVGSNPTPGTSCWLSGTYRPDRLPALNPKIPAQDSWTICRWSWCAGPGGDFNGFACPKTLPGPAGTAPRPVKRRLPDSLVVGTRAPNLPLCPHRLIRSPDGKDWPDSQSERGGDLRQLPAVGSDGCCPPPATLSSSPSSSLPSRWAALTSRDGDLGRHLRIAEWMFDQPGLATRRRVLVHADGFAGCGARMARSVGIGCSPSGGRVQWGSALLTGSVAGPTVGQDQSSVCWTCSRRCW